MEENEWPTGDASAQIALKTLFEVAMRRLSGLDEPIVVAACPNCFDDTAAFPHWLGAQIGEAVWDRLEYRGEGDTVFESSRNPQQLLIAQDTLRWLQESDWRLLVERAFDLQLFSEILAIIKQHGAFWFVISASNDGHDIAFLLQPSGALELVGIPARLDRRLGRIRPLLLAQIDPDAWPKLHAGAPAFPGDPPGESSVNREQSRSGQTQLVELLQGAFAQMAELPGSSHYIASSDSDPEGDIHDYRYVHDRKSHGPFFKPGWRAIATDDFHIDTPSWSISEHSFRRIAECPPAVSLNALLDSLESAKWRNLFAQGVLPISRMDTLALLQRGPENWLIAANTMVFSVTENGIDLVGARDATFHRQNPNQAAIHLFHDA